MTYTTLPTIQFESRRFDWGKFWRKFAIYIAYRAMGMAILIATGFALGLHLVRY